MAVASQATRGAFDIMKSTLCCLVVSLAAFGVACGSNSSPGGRYGRQRRGWKHRRWRCGHGCRDRGFFEFCGINEPRSLALAVEPRVFPLEGNRTGGIGVAVGGATGQGGAALGGAGLGGAGLGGAGLGGTGRGGSGLGGAATGGFFHSRRYKQAHLPVASGRGAQPPEGDLMLLPRAASSTGTTAPARRP